MCFKWHLTTFKHTQKKNRRLFFFLRMFKQHHVFLMTWHEVFFLKKKKEKRKKRGYLIGSCNRLYQGAPTGGFRGRNYPLSCTGFFIKGFGYIRQVQPVSDIMNVTVP